MPYVQKTKESEDRNDLDISEFHADEAGDK